MAYAAVTSLVYTISRFLKSDDNDVQIVQNSSPQMIKVLEEEADSLAKVLRGLDSNSRRFSSKKLSALDAQIRDAVFKLEDVVESHLQHQFHSQSENNIHQHPFVFSEELKQDIDYLIQMLNKLKGEYIFQLSNNNLPISDEEEDDDDDVIVKSEPRIFGILSNQLFMQIKDMILTASYDFDIFTLFGMAGIGKTTLARKLFEDPSVSSHYHIHVFVTVGPEYHLEDVLVDILKQLVPPFINVQDGITMINEQHQKTKSQALEWMLKKCLMNQKCLIALDDVLDEEILSYFSDLYSRGIKCNILITTRLVVEAEQMLLWKIQFLDKKVLVIEETDLVQWTVKDDYHIEDLTFLSIKHCYKLVKGAAYGFYHTS